MTNQISSSAASARESARSQDGKFGTQTHDEPADVALSGNPREDHSNAVEDAASRTGIYNGHAYEYTSTSLHANTAGQLEATINLDDVGDDYSTQLVHNYATGRTTFRSTLLMNETDDKELIGIAVDDICRDHEGDPEGMFTHLLEEAKSAKGLHPKVEALANSRSKTEARSFNPYSAKVGDRVAITRDGQDSILTIARIDPAGTYGTSHADGPHIVAHVRPGGYSVSLDGSNMSRYNARTVSDAELPEEAPKGPRHQCEKWQLLDHADGGKYCGACGERQPDNEPSPKEPVRDEYAAARPFTASAVPKP